MPPFTGFIGPSYQGRALAADAERSVNFFVERIESPGGATKSNFVMLSKPGLELFVDLSVAIESSVNAVRALAELNGRSFAVAAAGPNSLFFELHANGSATQYGANLPGDARPQLCVGQTQILVLLAGNGYIFDQAANTLTRIGDEDFPPGATKAAFLDGYFIVLEPNSQTFAISAYKDGTSWDALDFASVEGEPGNTVSLFQDHRLLWFFGNNHTEVYIDSGNADFPFTRYDSGLMEQGTSAIDSVARFDNALVWLGRNEDGANVVWRTNGFAPQRISTHAVETALSAYDDTSDAMAYTYQEGGHTFYVMHFPSARNGAGATWVYDAATGFWHERGWWDAELGDYRADLARCHCYAFGKHLVGDYRSGAIYEQSMDYYTDAGTPIRRVRAAPDLANGGKRMFYSELRLLMEAGVGLDSVSS